MDWDSAEVQSAYNDAIWALEESLENWAQQQGLPYERRERKNVATIVIADVISIELGHFDEFGHSGFISISTDDAVLYAPNGMVPAAAITGFITGFLAESPAQSKGE